MKNIKSLLLGGAFIALSLSFVLEGQAANPSFDSIPVIGSVEVLSAGSPNFAIRKGNLGKMGASDWVKVAVKGTDGLPYPLNTNGSRSGKPETMNIGLEFQLEKSDGTLTDSVDAPLINLAKAEFWLPASGVRERNICKTGSCPRDKNLLTNPLVSGVVYLKNIKATAVFTSGAPDLEKDFGMKVKLFTIGAAPEISVSKSSAKENETVILSGSNLDDYAAKTNRFSNTIIIDLDRGTVTDIGDLANYGRTVNQSLSKDAEDRVHYCDADEIKFDMPGNRRQFVAGKLKDFQTNFTDLPKLSLGKHTLTLVNDFGYSNTIDIDLVSGKGTPEDDSSCQNSSATITSISPTAGPVGTEVTIKGTNFTASKTATGYGNFNWPKFNGVTALDVTDFKYETYTGTNGFEAKRGTEIRVKVPSGATTGPVSVIPGLGYEATGPTFTVTASGSLTAGLSIESIFPETINLNTDNTILIKGEGFLAPTLKAGGITFSDIEISEDRTLLRATARPEGSAGTVKITVSDNDQEGSINASLAVKAAGSPSITQAALSDLGEDLSAELVIKGSNLAETTEVRIEGADATVTSFKATASELRVQLLFGEEAVQRGPSWLGVAKAFSDPANPSVVQACNGRGCDTFAVDTPQVNEGDPDDEDDGKDSGTNKGAFDFSYDNPFKGGVENVMDLLAVLAKFIFQLGVPVAVIVIIYSGITMIISSGNPGMYQRGITGLKYAALGLAVLLIGKGFVSLIQSILSIK